MEQGSKVFAGERESEDMQEYLARINKQLDEMQSQLQTVAPRRESLARATERYLQRRASGTDAAAPSAPEATMPTTSATTSARPSRNSSPEDVVADKLTQQPSSGNVTPKPVKYKSDGGFAAATPVAGNSPTELVDIPAAAVSPATTTPPRALSKELSWELQSQQLPGKQSPNNHSALFHSPQYRTSSGGGNASSISRQRSESMRGKISRANSASLAAAFEAAAAGAEEVEGSRVCIISRNASENGSRAGSRIPSFKWQQPTPQNTPEKASNRNGGVKPPKARARSQSGHIQQQQQQLATAGSSKVPTAAVSSGGNCSPVCSRSNSARFASTGGTCSSRRFVVSATNAVVDDTGIAAAVGDFKAAARATSAAAVEPQSEHELFAVINDAMEAAAAAVNKPEILVSSPGTRRFTSDNAVINSKGSESSMSVSDAKLNRQGSSLKGLATAATQLEELVSHLEIFGADKDNGQFLAEQQQQHSDAQVHALGETSESLQSKQQQQQKRQELDGQVTTSSFSVTDICGSEIVRQGSSDATVVGDGDDNDDDGDDDDDEDCTDEDVCASHQPAEDQEQTPPAVFDEADVTTIDMTAAATAVVQAEVASAAAETERSTDAASAGLDGNCPNQLQKLPMHGSFTNNHGGSSSSSSLSPWRRLVSDPGIVPQHTLTKQQQQWETPTKEQQMCDNPPKQQQQQQQQGVGSPGKQQSGSWSPSKQLKQLKSWFSDIRRSPSQQGSPQRPRHASDSGYIAAAAASGGSAGMLFTKAAQSPARTLSSSGFGCHVEDLPLRLLGQSGSIRSRSSSGSHASLAAAAAAAVRFDAAGSGKEGSSSGGSVSNQQLEQLQQMPELETVAQMSSSPAAAADISDASAAYSKPLPNVGTRLLSSVAPAAASAEAVTTTTAAAAADTSMHASAPAMLEGTAVSTYCSAAAASSLEDAEHDDVLFGSPAGSPASSYSHLNFQQRSAAAVAASRLGTESTAAGSLEQQAWQQHRALLLVTLPQPGHDTVDYAYTSPAAVAAVAAGIEGGDSPAVSDVQFASPSVEQQVHVQEDGGSSSSSSSVEISTSLGSSSSSGGLRGNAAFTSTAVDEALNAEVILDEVPDVPTFLTHGTYHQLVRQDENVAGDAAAASADTVCGRSLAITTGIQAYSIDISQSISPMAEESQLLEQQCDPAQEPLWQQQQQEDVVTHDPGITAAAAAAAGLSGHIDYNASFLGPEATEGSAEIVVEGHSMQIPDYAAIAVDAQQQQAAAVEYVVAMEVVTATAGGIIQPVVTSKQQHYDCYSQHHLQQQQQQQQQRVLSGPDHDSSAAAPLPAPDNAGKPSWTERMLGKVAAALKPTSSRSRVKSSASSSSGAAVAAGAIAPEPLSMCSDTQPVLASLAAADSGQQQPERQQQQQQQQQQCIEESQSLSAASFLAAVSEPVVDAAVPQHPQHQLYDSVIKSSSSSSGSSADTDVTCLRHYPLARAAAVAITGIGLSAVQGTPKPHIVACGSTMHAPTLACVSMLLASTSCTAASSSSGNAHAGCTAVEAAAAAVSLAVAAAAVVAAWLLDVNGNPEQTAGTAGDSVNSPTAVPAVAKQLQLHAASPTVGVQEKPTPALPAVPGVLSPQPAAEPSGSSSSSSIETSDLPELIADVSKTQYSRPGTAEYDAGKYTEPLSPIGNADSSTSTDSTVLTSPPHTQQQQKQQGLVRPQGQQQQMHQQQQQLRRIQLSGSSWSPCKSPRAADAAPVVWLQQMTSHWGLHHNQQQQLRGPSEALSLPASGRELASSSSRRAVSAVQQLKQRQLNRRSTIGASSTAEHAAGMTGNAVHMQAALQTVQQQQMQQQHMEQQQAAQQQGQQQQVQQQQHQLPLLGPGEMCLGHGIMGASLPHDQQQQQQQQWFKEQEQQQQQPPSPIQELSCTDYYRQLVQQQQEQQQTQQQHTDMDSSSLKPRLDSTSSLNSSSSAIATAGSSGGSSGGSRQLAALARLRQQRHQRLSQQASFQGDSVITAAAAAAVGGGSSNSKYTIAAGEWGSGGGAEHAEGDDCASEQQQYQPAAAAAARAAWGDPTAPAAAEYMPPQQQQQHLRPASHQQQVTSSSRPPSVPNSASAAAAVSSRGWSTDTGASAAGDTGDGDTAAAGSSGSGSSAKPFLKRKSRSIVSQKLDWSSVPSRTVHKLDDRYVPPSKGRKPHSTSSYNPALAAAQSRAGLMSAAGRSTAAAAARGSSANSATGRRTPHAGYEPGYEMEIRSSTYYRPKSTGAAAAGAAVANGSGRRSSPATTAAAGSGEGYSSRRGGYAAGGMAGVATAAGESMSSRKSFRLSSAESDDPQQKIGRVSAGDGAYEGAALDPGAPLDDLLNHVNNLIKEFDRMYK